jgi:hypothetical protein
MRAAAKRRDDADAEQLVPFDRLPAEVRDEAARALSLEILRRQAPDDLLVKLAGRLRRADDGALLVELEFPRVDSYPTNKDISNFGRAGAPAWVMKILCNTHEDVAEGFWLAVNARSVPLAEAVELCCDPAKSPISIMDARRVEIAQRHADAEKAGAAQREARRQAEAADASWLGRNSHRVSRWRELPAQLQHLALAADESDDPRLQKFVARAIELSTSHDSHPRPPSFLWPLK